MRCVPSSAPASQLYQNENENLGELDSSKERIRCAAIQPASLIAVIHSGPCMDIESYIQLGAGVWESDPSSTLIHLAITFTQALSRSSPKTVDGFEIRQHAGIAPLKQFTSKLQQTDSLTEQNTKTLRQNARCPLVDHRAGTVHVYLRIPRHGPDVSVVGRTVACPERNFMDSGPHHISMLARPPCA